MRFAKLWDRTGSVRRARCGGRGGRFALPGVRKNRRMTARSARIARTSDGRKGVAAMGKTVLVTGAGGFIGSHLTERLVRDGHEVRVLVRYNGRDDRGQLDRLPRESRRAIEVHRGDLKDPEAVRKAVEGRAWVFHLGALIAIPYSYQNPLDVVQTNVLGTAHVLDACRASAGAGAGGADLDVRGLRHGAVRPDRREAPAPGPVALRGDARSAPTPWARATTAPSACRWRSSGRSTRSARASRPARSSRRSSARR